jgi:hypothetical protein
MKKVYVLDYDWKKRIFFLFNNLKKYLREKVFINMKLTNKEINLEISSLHLEKANSWDFRQFYYLFKDIKIYNLKEYWLIK